MAYMFDNQKYKDALEIIAKNPYGTKELQKEVKIIQKYLVKVKN